MERLKLSHDKSKFQIDKSKAELEIAKLTRDEAKVDLKNYKILTPFKGIVTEIIKHPGEAVRQGEPILKLVNTDTVYVEGQIPFEYINRVKVGQRVYVQNLQATIGERTSEGKYFKTDLKSSSSEIRKKIFKGKISFIDVSVKSGRGTVKIRAEVANQENLLRDGLIAEMIINVKE